MPRRAKLEDLLGAHQAIATGPALGAKFGATFCLARLFVKLADANLFLNTATFHQFPEPTDRFLSRLFVAQSQLNHARLPFRPFR